MATLHVIPDWHPVIFQKPYLVRVYGKGCRPKWASSDQRYGDKSLLRQLFLVPGTVGCRFWGQGHLIRSIMEAALLLPVLMFCEWAYRSLVCLTTRLFPEYQLLFLPTSLVPKEGRGIFNNNRNPLFLCEEILHRKRDWMRSWQVWSALLSRRVQRPVLIRVSRAGESTAGLEPAAVQPWVGPALYGKVGPEQPQEKRYPVLPVFSVFWSPTVVT